MKLPRMNLDTLGICASALCMVHCMVLPFALAALPLLLPASSAEAAVDTHAKTHAACTESSCCPSHAAPAEEGQAGIASLACCSSPAHFWIHAGMLALVAPVGMAAWGAGFRRHQCRGVVALGLLGVALLCAALVFGHQFMNGRGEQMMTIAGSCLLVGAHFWNHRKCRCCANDEGNELWAAALSSQRCK